MEQFHPGIFRQILLISDQIHKRTIMTDQSDILTRIVSVPHPLSPDQRAAVVTNGRHIRIVAGAGAGKTETLTRKIIALLLHNRVPPSAIVAFTFTEKAAQSMKSRIFSQCRIHGGEELASRLGEMYIGTIHAYCFRLLNDLPEYAAYGAFDQNQEMAFILDRGFGLNLPGGEGYPRKCEKFAQTLGVVYSEMIPDATLERQAPDFYRAYTQYKRLLDHHHRLTFDRMISLAIAYLEAHPESAQSISHLIVDEYQDINRAQQCLITLLGAYGSIFLVGDPRQTIYEWRGSDSRCFAEFLTTYPDAEKYSITENRRSSRSIVEVTNACADLFSEHFDHIDPVKPEVGGAYLAVLPSNRDEAEWTADQIEKYVTGGASYSDFAILLRSVTTSGQPFLEALARRNIPYQVGGKIGLFRRPEAQALAKLFAWVSSDGFFQKNRFDWKNRINGDDLLTSALEDWDEAVPGVVDITAVVETLSVWKTWALGKKKWQVNHFSGVLQQLLKALGYHKLDPDAPAHTVVMANIGRFNTLLTDYENAIMLGGARPSWEKRFSGLVWYLYSYAISAYDEQSDSENAGMNAVQVMTIHQSKGLEWPIVFIPCVAVGRFPSSRTGRAPDWMIPTDILPSDRVAMYSGSTEAERKLLYVAMTRAKDVLCVSRYEALESGTRRRASELLTEDQGFVERFTPLNENDHIPMYPLNPGEGNDEIETYGTRDLIDFMKCPYKYRFNHVWNYKPGLYERLGYGIALHHCLRMTADLITSDDLPPAMAAASAVEEHFFLPFANEAMVQQLKVSATDALMTFAEANESDLRRIREVETRVEFPLENAVVAGRVDVILHDGAGIEVRDYKSSDTVVSDEEASMQVRLYAKALDLLDENVTRASLAYILDNDIREITTDETMLKAAENHARSAVEAIRGRRFSACPGDACSSCDYTTICRYTSTR